MVVKKPSGRTINPSCASVGTGVIRVVTGRSGVQSKIQGGIVYEFTHPGHLLTHQRASPGTSSTNPARYILRQRGLRILMRVTFNKISSHDLFGICLKPRTSLPFLHSPQPILLPPSGQSISSTLEMAITALVSGALAAIRPVTDLRAERNTHGAPQHVTACALSPGKSEPILRFM